MNTQDKIQREILPTPDITHGRLTSCDGGGLAKGGNINLYLKGNLIGPEECLNFAMTRQ